MILAALALSACTATPPVAVAPPPVAVPTIPPGMQYLYGSGEAAAESVQMWQGLVSYAETQVRARPSASVILDEGATLASPRFVSCGAKPFAAVFDVDETVLLNLGFEYDDATHPGRRYDEKRWQEWERTGGGKVDATPGATKALNALRQLGITVIFNTNRSVETADSTAKTLTDAGLGPAVHKQTLWLKGDDNTGGLKDVRRWWIADKYCVIAMGGDQLGDFSDLFNAGLAPAARRTAVMSAPIAAKFGAGWFVLPNPVYGTALKGGIDQVFPADKRWTPPVSGEK
ncbi:HAD family acid phosphatase [Sphingomonas sp. PAMC 26605]|uniref:HAD family acid phosphatase n=1 Tax=Sphingomonas sp. PAMC 26605 TaxID=1112214 RepID=UPI00026CD194